MTKVIELEGRSITIRFKSIEINGKEVISPAEIEVSDLPLKQQETLNRPSASMAESI